MTIFLFILFKSTTPQGSPGYPILHEDRVPCSGGSQSADLLIDERDHAIRFAKGLPKQGETREDKIILNNKGLVNIKKKEGGIQ